MAIRAPQYNARVFMHGVGIGLKMAGQASRTFRLGLLRQLSCGRRRIVGIVPFYVMMKLACHRLRTDEHKRSQQAAPKDSD